MKRKVFFSFHYRLDSHRASQIRNIGALEAEEPVSSNRWEQIKNQGDSAVRAWIARELSDKSCLVVLVGEQTASRPWVKYEIEKAWNDGKGVVGLRIHKLKDLSQATGNRGPNPFDAFKLQDGRQLNSVAKLYDPAGADSKAAYGWITRHLANAVEEAIAIRRAV